MSIGLGSGWSRAVLGNEVLRGTSGGKSRRRTTRRAAKRHQSIWLCLLTLVGCGDGVFSNTYSQEIQQDCFQTLQCDAKEMVSACVTKSGQVLDNASEEQQQRFLDALERCKGSTTCGQYSACTFADPTTSYSGMHMQEIVWDCQQRQACQPTADQATCVMETINRLNLYPDQQVVFSMSFTRCAAPQNRAGCAWVQCRAGG
jgi:hypothetical protein